MPLLNPASLKHSFSASHYVQASKDILFPERLTTRAQWILARSLCLFRTFDIEAIPRKRRESTVALLVKRWAPFAQPGFHAVWSDRHVAVWVWDNDKVTASIDEVGVQALSTLPESVYYPQHEGTGARWLRSADTGEIFQLWINAELVVEKWFAQHPNQNAFDLFLRTIVLPAHKRLAWDELQRLCHDAPQTTTFERLQNPWGARNKLWALVQKLPWENSVVLVAAVVLAVSYLWMLSSSLLTALALNDVKRRTDAIAASVEPVLQARTTAETLNATNAGYLLLLDYPPQTALLSDISAIVTTFALALKEWDYKGGRLEIVLEGSANSLSVVQAFEKLDWTSSVSVSSTRNQAQNRYVLTLVSGR